jgi:hypothetical protein
MAARTADLVRRKTGCGAPCRTRDTAAATPEFPEMKTGFEMQGSGFREVLSAMHCGSGFPAAMIVQARLVIAGTEPCS